MTDYKTLTVELDERGVAFVTLNRPDKRNAMSAQMIDDLTHMATNLGNGEETRVIVLSGAGKTFCAGGDLQWMKAQIEADAETRGREARKLANMLRALNEMTTPLIGRVHGGAFGGGIGLLCVCDVVIAQDDMKFGLTETRLGLIPATIGPYVVARVGEGAARQFFMSSRLFGAAEARRLGLIAQAVPSADLQEAVEEQVAPYLAVAPNAVGAAKELLRVLSPPIDDEVIDETIRRLARAWESVEASEGIDAFLNKRPARWTRD